MASTVKALVESVVKALVVPCQHFVGYIMSLENNVRSLETEIGELTNRRDDLKEKVRVAKMWGWEPSIPVQEWLNRADSLESEATSIQVEWEKRVRCLGDCSVNVCWSYDCSKRAEDKLKKAMALKDTYDSHDELVKKMVPAGSVRMPYPELIGRESVLEQLRHDLVGDEVGIIGIHGMGGVGKTALLETLHNEFLTKFAVIWIDATRSNVEEIQRALGDQLGLSWEGNNLQTTERATILRGALSKMQFMLILDGLWEYLDLKMVGIPRPDHGSRSKIILTTRMETVCDQMGAKKVKVECLAPKEAWDLFQNKAGEKKELIESDWQIQQCANQLAKKCDGLPLALITIGHHMGNKDSVEEWKYTVTSLNTKPWRVQGMVEVFECLKVSYEKLHDTRLKTCLLYASFIDDYFDKVWFINYCVGEGIIDDFENPEEAYNSGHHLLGGLKSASMLEKGDKEDNLKMHPMIRKTVMWVECECGEQKNKLIVRSGNSLGAPPHVETWSEAARISLTHNQILDALPPSPVCPNVLTLFLHHNSCLNKIPGRFFESMLNLKVLDLSFTSIRELPAGIGSLIRLQHLNLRQTQITSLPIQLRRLKNLRLLNLHSTYGLEVAPHLIASLSALRVLQMYGSNTVWEASSSREGMGVEELGKLKALRVLGITLGTVSALERLSRSSRLATATRELYLWTCSGLTTIRLPSATFGRNMWSLRSLTIAGCCDLEEVIIGSDGWSFFPCLEDILLHRLPRAKIIWGSRSLQSLKNLRIWDCEKIEQLLEFEEEKAERDGEREPFVAFPTLVEIQLKNLPEFSSLSIGGRALGFPSLRALHVGNCPKLKKLTLGTAKVVEITGEQKWWDALDWENGANNKSSLHFKPEWDNANIDASLQSLVLEGMIKEMHLVDVNRSMLM